MKYAKEVLARQSDSVGKCPFRNVDMVMMIKLAAIYEYEQARMGRIKLEYEYARLNDDMDVFDF